MLKEPSTYKEAISGRDKDKWQASMETEMGNLHKNGTWEIVDRPRDRNILCCKWVYKLKKNKDGKIERYKSRLVAKGYNQRYGEDYWETYAPVGDYAIE